MERDPKEAIGKAARESGAHRCWAMKGGAWPFIDLTIVVRRILR